MSTQSPSREDLTMAELEEILATEVVKFDLVQFSSPPGCISKTIQPEIKSEACSQPEEWDWTETDTSKLKFEFDLLHWCNSEE